MANKVTVDSVGGVIKVVGGTVPLTGEAGVYDITLDKGSKAIYYIGWYDAAGNIVNMASDPVHGINHTVMRVEDKHGSLLMHGDSTGDSYAFYVVQNPGIVMETGNGTQSTGLGAVYNIKVTLYSDVTRVTPFEDATYSIQAVTISAETSGSITATINVDNNNGQGHIVTTGTPFATISTDYVYVQSSAGRNDGFYKLASKTDTSMVFTTPMRGVDTTSDAITVNAVIEEDTVVVLQGKFKINSIPAGIITPTEITSI